MLQLQYSIIFHVSESYLTHDELLIFLEEHYLRE